MLSPFDGLRKQDLSYGTTPSVRLKTTVEEIATGLVSGAQVFKFCRDTGKALQTNFSPKSQQTNTDVVLPSFIFALNGDRTAQYFYEGRRLVQYNALEPWAQKYIFDTAKWWVDQFDPVAAARANHAERRTRHKLGTVLFTEEHFGDLLLNACCTYADFSELLSLLNKINYPDRYDASIDQVAGGGVDTRFNPTHETPMGKFAYKAFEKIIPFMLNARVLEDFLSYFNISITDQSKLRIATSMNSAWELLSLKSVKNIIKVKWAIDSGGLEGLSPDQQQLAFNNFLGASDPVAYIRKKLLQQPSASHTAVEESSLASPQAQASLPSYRKRFIQGIIQEIALSFPDTENKQCLAGEFYRLHSKDICSLVDIVNALEAGTNPVALRDSMMSRLIARDETEKGKETIVEPVQQPLVAEVCRYDGRYKVLYESERETSPFLDWYNKLDPPVQRRIDARITGMQNGNLGDYKLIRSGIFEARLNFGAGYRIYFSVGRDNTLLILMGGQKDRHQDSDIVVAEEFFARVKTQT